MQVNEEVWGVLVDVITVNIVVVFHQRKKWKLY